MPSSDICDKGEELVLESSGWDSWDQSTTLVSEEAESPVFHLFDELPAELRELVWEQVILNDLRAEFDWSGYWAPMSDFRLASSAVANESRAVFCKHSVFHIRPCEYDESQNTRSICDSLIPRIQNLHISLTREHNHKFALGSGTLPSYTTYELLEDGAKNLVKLRTKGIRRNECHLFAETKDDEFQAPAHIVRRLQHLGDFKTVIFNGFFIPSSWDTVQPNGTFESLRLVLEIGLGPATIVDDSPYNTEFVFHPRQHRNMGYESGDGESEGEDDADHDGE